MKTNLVDFLLSGLVIGLIASADVLLVSNFVAPFSFALLGGYHIILDTAMLLLFYGLISALTLRILLSRYPLLEGEYAMTDRVFSYWKFYTVVHEFGRCALLPFTTVFAKPLVAKLFGAKVGSNTAMGGMLVDPPFIRIDDSAILGLNSAIVAHAITSGSIILKSVSIGRGATVGVHAVIMPGVCIGDGSVITAGSVVTMNTDVPPNEMWGGIPARKIKNLQATDIRN